MAFAEAIDKIALVIFPAQLAEASVFFANINQNMLTSLHNIYYFYIKSSDKNSYIRKSLDPLRYEIASMLKISCYDDGLWDEIEVFWNKFCENKKEISLINLKAEAILRDALISGEIVAAGMAESVRGVSKPTPLPSAYWKSAMWEPGQLPKTVLLGTGLMRGSLVVGEDQLDALLRTRSNPQASATERSEESVSQSNGAKRQGGRPRYEPGWALIEQLVAEYIEDNSYKKAYVDGAFKDFITAKIQSAKNKDKKMFEPERGIEIAKKILADRRARNLK